MKFLELLAIKDQEVKASDLVSYQQMTCQTSIGTCLAEYCHTHPLFRQALTLPQADVLFNGCVFLSPRYLSSFAEWGSLFEGSLPCADEHDSAVASQIKSVLPSTAVVV